MADLESAARSQLDRGRSPRNAPISGYVCLSISYLVVRYNCVCDVFDLLTVLETPASLDSLLTELRPIGSNFQLGPKPTSSRRVTPYVSLDIPSSCCCCQTFLFVLPAMGVTSAFQDVVALVKCVDGVETPLAEALVEYERARRIPTALIQLVSRAVMVFIEKVLCR